MVPLQQQVQLPEVDEYDCTAHKVKANVVEKFLTLHNLKNKSGFSFDLEQPENESLNNTINYVLLDVKVQTAHSKWLALKTPSLGRMRKKMGLITEWVNIYVTAALSESCLYYKAMRESKLRVKKFVSLVLFLSI